MKRVRVDHSLAPLHLPPSMAPTLSSTCPCAIRDRACVRVWRKKERHHWAERKIVLGAHAHTHTHTEAEASATTECLTVYVCVSVCVCKMHYLVPSIGGGCSNEPHAQAGRCFVPAPRSARARACSGVVNLLTSPGTRGLARVLSRSRSLALLLSLWFCAKAIPRYPRDRRPKLIKFA